MRRASNHVSGAGRRHIATGLALAIAAIAQAPIAAPALSQPTTDASRLDALFWESVADSDDRAQYSAYLARFPTGVFADLARLKIAAIDRRTGGMPTAAMPAPLAPQPAPPAPVAPPVVAPAAAMRAAAPAAASTASPAGMSDADLFASAMGQGARPFATPAEVTQALPPAPVLTPVPELALPARFCSAEARNAFHETAYKAAKAVADDNNRKTIEHVRAIQQVYDRFEAQHDTPAMTHVSREATAYQAVSQQAYRESSAMARRYDELMAVPIGNCAEAK